MRPAAESDGDTFTVPSTAAARANTAASNSSGDLLRPHARDASTAVSSWTSLTR